MYPDRHETHDNFTFSNTPGNHFALHKVAYWLESKAIRIAKFNPSGTYLATGTLTSAVRLYRMT